MDGMTKFWLAGASLHERGHQRFTKRELYDEIALQFPGTNRKVLPGKLAQILRDQRTYKESYFVTVSGELRLTTAADRIRWDQERWPSRDRVGKHFQPLWERVVEMLKVEQTAAAAHAEVAVSAIEEEQADPSVHFTHSSYREAMLEHLLIGELMRHLWPKRLLEVCKPQVDRAGYDLILQCDGVLRHVQLKTSTLAASTASVNLHVELWKRQGGCVIWTRFEPETLVLKEFWWLGGPLPALEELEMAKHTKGNAQGEKALRPSLRTVPKGCFKRLGSVAELVEHLFGS